MRSQQMGGESMSQFPSSQKRPGTAKSGMSRGSRQSVGGGKKKEEAGYSEKGKTDQNGLCVFTDVPADTYQVTVLENKRIMSANKVYIYIYIYSIYTI